MSTENEGTAAPTPPAAPSAPPVPVAASTTPEPSSAGRPGAAPVDASAHEAHPPAPGAGTEPTRQIPAAAPPAPPAYGQTSPGAQDPYGQTPQGQAPYGQAPAAHGAEGWPPPPPTVPAYGGDGGHGGDTWGAPLTAHGAPAPKPKGRGGLIAAVLVAALLAGGVGGGVGYWAAERGNDGAGSTTITATTPKDLKREPGSVAGLAAGSLPSVVTIEASAGDGEGGTGTGFVYDEEGHILTNNHVVASAANGGKLTATFSNGKKYDAEVVGRAQGYDVAVIKLKNAPTGLKPLPLGDSDKVAVGDSTIAIGAPFGLSNTVTTGIISAKNRPVASGDASGGKNSYMSALQTDASINPGNSGGPLLDGRGAVIGINSAIQSAGNGGFGGGQAGSIGLGFAIPINQAKNVAQSLIKTGKPVYPIISVSVDLQAKVEGAKISEQGASANELVDPNGPAGKAGLKPGDIITQFGGKPIDSGPTLISEIWTYKPGDTVKLTYLRDGKPNTVDITLGSRVGDKP
ncbi:S1C family serine protease [Streptomyces sp. A1136]|uniref:S1C family serine protease n=1 Tax=Streptomyces sp. A1136 TaxID=2563102 RepID=UPI00109E44F3|nr:trypsin-like peptidase domain-containing protein [Streptomyces sp. A1136]THA59327.1 PDZ domain-containing protein [Streptomyces sp. A1136]